MPLQATSGAASYDGFGGGVVAEPNYIESCFSTWLYTGNGSTQTITNGIDLSTKGGMVWIKDRSISSDQMLYDTARGAGAYLRSNTTSAQSTSTSYQNLTSFTSSGFSLGAASQPEDQINKSGDAFASWTFRKQPKFFDVVTFTGTGSVQNISHNLGSVPACMFVKNTTNGGTAWSIYHTGLGNTQYLAFTTAGAGTSSGYWNNTSPTSTQFTVGTDANVNQSGDTYVAYLFAHNAGGFGLTGTDNVISCGTFTGGTGGVTVTLGYEPQWVLLKNTDASGLPWLMWDNMRGFPVGTGGKTLEPNSDAAEATTSWISPTATGFVLNPAQLGAVPMIYIAIRRGPMKVPTVGTSVFEPALYTGNGSTSRTFTTSTVAPIDLSINLGRTGTGGVWTVDRLRGNGVIRTWATNAEVSSNTSLKFDVQNGYSNTGTAVNYDWNTNTLTNVQYFMKRAPSFFDVVCYTTGAGTGITTFNHNLTVTPELVISKVRSAVDDWYVYAQPLGTSKTLYLNANVAEQGFTCTDSLSSTQAKTYLGVGAATAVSYLFATCAGVSKVGSFTGNGSSQTINCGFTGGARFVLIKKSSGTGDWMVSDSARGIIAGSDPYLELNNTNAEVTGEDWLDTDSTGFVVNEVSGSNANTNGATYIFLAIA